MYPEISEMQARAVFEGAAEVQKAGIKVKPEVMIPLVGFKRELDLQVAVGHAAAKAVMAEKKVKLNYMVGTMIEVPRGALGRRASRARGGSRPDRQEGEEEVIEFHHGAVRMLTAPFCFMPELARFYGITICMFVEAGEPHKRPHFHAYYAGDVAVYGLSPVELIARVD